MNLSILSLRQAQAWVGRNGVEAVSKDATYEASCCPSAPFDTRSALLRMLQEYHGQFAPKLKCTLASPKGRCESGQMEHELHGRKLAVRLTPYLGFPSEKGSQAQESRNLAPS